MRGHVVRTLLVVGVAVVLGRQPVEPAGQIDPHRARGVLLDQQRGGGVAAQQTGEALGDPGLRHPAGNLAGDLGEALPGGGEAEHGGGLAHRTHIGRVSLQHDLFAPLPQPPLVPGFALWPDFVTPGEEPELAARVDAAPLAPFRFGPWEGKRLTTYYGHGYDFGRGRLDPAPPLPDWLRALAGRAEALIGQPPGAFCQALLIRYDPGAGIGWHRDRPQFGTVVGLSLSEPVKLRLRRRTDRKSVV